MNVARVVRNTADVPVIDALVTLPVHFDLNQGRLGSDNGVDVAFVLDEEGEGFRLEGGAAGELSAEARALMERVASTNPLLWHGEDRNALLDEAGWTVEVVTETHDAVALTRGDPSILDREVHASCPVAP